MPAISALPGGDPQERFFDYHLTSTVMSDCNITAASFEAAAKLMEVDAVAMLDMTSSSRSATSTAIRPATTPAHAW